MLLKNLALDEIDLSLSNQYDPQTDTYRFIGTPVGGGEFSPSRFEYKNGIWTAEYHQVLWDESLSCYYVLNDDHRIIRIDDKANKYGDINGNENTDIKDLVRFRKYLSDGAIEVTENALDMNDDVEIDEKDYLSLIDYLLK